MLYPPEPGTWGSGTRAIVVTDSLYFMNRGFADDVSGQLGHHFTKIDLDGINYQVTDTIHNPNIWIAEAGLISDTKGFFIDITSNSIASSSQQYAIVKYNSLGKVQFYKINGNTYPYIYIKQIIITLNNSSISTGDLDEIGNSWKDQKILLLKNDSLGNEIWKKTYSIGSFAEKGESVSLCTDGGFIIGGSELIINGSDRFYSPIVIKTDSNGNVEWGKKYGSAQYSNWPAYGITQTLDGGYAFCGGVGTFDTLNANMQMPWIVKLDNSGNILWADTNFDNTSVSSENYYRDIIELNDGSLIACGRQLIGFPRNENPTEFRRYGIIKKVTKNGTKIWTRFFSHPDITNGTKTHFLYDIDPTPDGGFVAAGWAAFTADNVQSTWVIKVDSFGCLVPGCEVVSVPKIEPPIASLKVYPNPTSEILNIEITPSTLRGPQGTQNEFVFELYDILGKRVLVKKLHPFENTINVSNLPSGVYTYKIGSTWGQIVKQF